MLQGILVSVCDGHGHIRVLLQRFQPKVWDPLRTVIGSAAGINQSIDYSKALVKQRLVRLPEKFFLKFPNRLFDLRPDLVLLYLYGFESSDPLTDGGRK